MTAPQIWFIFPILVASVIWLIEDTRTISFINGSICLVLALLAMIIPPDSAITFLEFSVKIESGFILLGRSFSLAAQDQFMIVSLFGFGAFWFYTTLRFDGTKRSVLTAMAVLGILVGALSVQPFLYSAILIELATLISIPGLITPGQKQGKGLVRFLINQTLGLPFILLAGFLLSGVEAGPNDLAIVLQATLMLGVGFAFLLSVFPFYTWAAMLSDEVEPYQLSFLMLVIPMVGSIVGIEFIDKYSWLRNSTQLYPMLQIIGIITIVTTSVWAAFQIDLKRIMAFSLASISGYSLIAISISNHLLGVQYFFLLIPSTFLVFSLWSYALSRITQDRKLLLTHDLSAIADHYPVASTAILVSTFAMGGLPLLAMFPVKASLWQQLTMSDHHVNLILFGFGFVGYFIAGLRTLSGFYTSRTELRFNNLEADVDRWIMITLIVLIILLGIFPSLQIFGSTSPWLVFTNFSK